MAFTPSRPTETWVRTVGSCCGALYLAEYSQADLTDGATKDVFVHISAVEKAGLSDLREGTKVSYDVIGQRRVRKICGCSEDTGGQRRCTPAARSSLEAHMAYTAILQRIRLLIPAELDGHYNAVRRGFEEGDLTAPSLSISDMQLARAISEFTSYPPNESFDRDTRETSKPAILTSLIHSVGALG